MSYQKKSIILQELEQAIRKKAQDKSRNKEQVGYFYNYAVGPYKTPVRKKTAIRTANKEHRVGSINRN